MSIDMKLGDSPTYIAWVAMKQRCFNPRRPNYKYYGGRGISVCDRWLESFDNFLAHMGERPPNRSLDRIDVNGHYEPGNCRWADVATQATNRRPRDKTTWLKGQDAGRAKLSEQQALEIRQSSESIRVLARRFNLSVGAVHAIKTRKTWRHLA